MRWRQDSQRAMAPNLPGEIKADRSAGLEVSQEVCVFCEKVKNTTCKNSICHHQNAAAAQKEDATVFHLYSTAAKRYT